MRKFTVFALFASCSCFSLLAQKIKYKDVFPLVQAANWDAAEPLLKAYLADPKNASDASARYSMGKLYERKALMAGIIQDTAVLFNYIDSANLHFRAALQLINEKELKKNDEYYQEFNRRDLRTGEFGIKVSDVHLDIENKIKALEERRQSVQTFHRSVQEAESLAAELDAQMLQLKEEFVNQNGLLIGYGDRQQETLLAIEGKGNSLKQLIEQAGQATASIPSAGFSFSVEEKNIDDISGYRTLPLNIRAGGTAQVWNYAEWASAVKLKVRTEILPLRQELIAYDRELEAKKQQIEQAGVAQGVVVEPDQALLERLRRYGANSVTERLLLFKVEELNFLLGGAPQAFPDSVDIDAMYLKHSQMLSNLAAMEELLDLTPQELEGAFRGNPAFYESRYISSGRLNEFVAEKREWLAGQQEHWNAKLSYWVSRRQWMITSAGDSISLLVMDSLPQPEPLYRTLHLFDSLGMQVSGLKSGGKDWYFFASKISKSYTPAWLIEEKLPLPDRDFVFSPAHINHAPAPEGCSTFYTHFPVKGKTHLFITSIDSLGNPLWKVSTDIPRPPVKVAFNKMVMETIIYLDEPAVAPSGELTYLVIDRSGKLRK